MGCGNGYVTLLHAPKVGEPQVILRHLAHSPAPGP